MSRPRGRCSLGALTPAAIASLLLTGCASGRPDLAALDREIDVEGFMGAWYVLAFIPIDFPFFSEAGAHDAVEHYALDEDGGIDITYTFRDGSFDAEPTVMKQSGRVHDEERGTEWRVQLVWPFESAYLIAWVDEDYEHAIVGVPSRRFVWVMARRPQVSDARWRQLYERVSELGYDSDLLRRVPHRTGAASRPQRLDESQPLRIDAPAAATAMLASG